MAALCMITEFWWASRFDHEKKVGVIIDMDFLSLDFNDEGLLSHEISIVKITIFLSFELQNPNFPFFLMSGLFFWLF